MRDPLNWSFPLGRIFGITIKVHLFLIVVFLGLWLRAVLYPRAPEGIGLAVAVLLGFTFLSILLHEFGHCFAARGVDGDAHEILMWPLGGLAYSDIPNTPRAHFITAAGGPLVNLLLCAITGSILAAYGFIPPYNPMPNQALFTEMWNWQEGVWYGSKFSALADGRVETWWQFLLAQFFWINYFLFLLNVLLIGFPLDGGRMFQAMLWPRLGYRQSMLTTVFIGFIVMLVVGLISIVANELLVLCLALVIFFACRQQWIILETGHEESLFGYDFSQGYTSLEQHHHREDEPKPRKKKPNFFQRWLQRRAQKKMQKQMEQMEAEEKRMDALLEKIQRSGAESLTDEENRFLKRVSNRYRNRQ